LLVTAFLAILFVAECDEISNLDLIRDIVGIIKLQEFLQLRI